MATLKSVVFTYQDLAQEWNRTPRNLDKCGTILTELKVALTQLSFLPTEGSTTTKQELLIARDILEIGAQWAIAKKDVETFERYISQLKCYYFDYKDDLPDSAYKFQLLGLNLLRLLAQNKLADFHTELEHFQEKELHNSIYIKHPVSIEQYLMEGSYNKVFLAKGNVPADDYNFFMDILLHTIRDDIAGCIEHAYVKLNFKEAGRMLFLDSEKAMTKYAEERKWSLGSDNFFRFHQEEKNTDDRIPAKNVCTQIIDYAKELEMIV